jgi:hypothetical protein
MIINFSEFLLEKLILESKIVYSEKFKKVLSKMSDNKIAQTLLELENNDLDIVSNFIGLKKDDDSLLTFTPDRVAQQILKSNINSVKYTGGRGGWLTNNPLSNKYIFEQLGYTPETKEVFQPEYNQIGELISSYTSSKTNKTWCYVKFQNGQGVYNRDKLSEATTDLEEVVFTRSRQDIRIGRLVKVILSAKMNEPVQMFSTNNLDTSDSEIEKFVNEFRAAVKIINDVFSNLEIVEGDQLGFWYHRDNYVDRNRGSLGTSCQAVGRLDWLEIYIKNPQTIKLLILKSESQPNKILGRALLWKLDDGNILMDQVYTNYDCDNKIFLDYAKEMGWSTTYNDGHSTFVATVKPQTFDKYPSIDNMNNWDPRTGKISNKPFPGSSYIRWTEDEDDHDDYDDYDEYL